MTTTYFNFKINDDLSTTEILFSGELKGLLPFQAEDFLKLQKKIRSDAESKIVLLNLNDVGFWDTEGMRQILKFASEVNEKVGYNRVVIIAPTDGYLIRRAAEKYQNMINVSVPWFASEEEM